MGKMSNNQRRARQSWGQSRWDAGCGWFMQAWASLSGPRVLLLLVVSCIWIGEGRAEDGAAGWGQWRGPHRDGRVVGQVWPKDLSKLETVWEVELGPSYSGPIVLGDRVFVTETKDRKFEVVKALDRRTGKVLWETQWEGALSVPFFAKANGDWIRATPATDGERLYVAGMRDLLVCLDVATGNTLWKVDFVERFSSPLPAFGFVSSPLLIDDAVYVQAGGGFVKLNKMTGETIWRKLEDGGGMWGSAFSSPVFVSLNNTSQLVVQSRNELAGVTPTGDILWKREIPAFRGMNILTPTIIGDSIFVSSYGGKSLMLSTSAADSGWQLGEKWTNNTQAYMSSPVVIDGHIYLHLRNKRFTCIDQNTGETKWTTEPFGDYWSMTYNGDKILALDSRGELLLIQANPTQFELLGQAKVADDSWAHLAIADNELVVRDLKKIKLLRW
jgi:outer membrane protein assembly factor BamB